MYISISISHTRICVYTYIYMYMASLGWYQVSFRPIYFMKGQAPHLLNGANCWVHLLLMVAVVLVVCSLGRNGPARSAVFFHGQAPC